MRRVITTEVSNMFITTANKGYGLYSKLNLNKGNKENKSFLLSPGSYSTRAVDYVLHDETATALRGGLDSGYFIVGLFCYTRSFLLVVWLFFLCLIGWSTFHM
jgi:hypothetical protein